MLVVNYSIFITTLNNCYFYSMLLVLAVKTYVLGGCMTPIAFAVLGTGILFGCYNLAVARNPEENENLFNATLMGFALMETFVFTSLIVGYLIYSL